MIRASICTDPSLRSHSSQRLAAGRLLRRALHESFGLSGRDVDLVTNTYGRPSLASPASVHLSVSHCSGAVLVAVSDRPVGVDVEEIRPRNPYAASRMLQPVEVTAVERSEDPDREFFRHWVVKESYLKALGVGVLVYPVRRLAVVIASDGSVRLNRPRAVLSLDERVDGFLQATCCLSEDPAEVPVTERVDLSDLQDGGRDLR